MKGSSGVLGLSSFDFVCRARRSSASATSVRPHMMAMRQSSGADVQPLPLTRVGEFSPVSKASMAASQ